MSKKQKRGASHAKDRGNNGKCWGSRTKGNKRRTTSGPSSAPMSKTSCQQGGGRCTGDGSQPVSNRSAHKAFGRCIEILLEQEGDVSLWRFLAAVKKIQGLLGIDHRPTLDEIKRIFAKAHRDDALRSMPLFFPASTFILSGRLERCLESAYKDIWHYQQGFSSLVMYCCIGRVLSDLGFIDTAVCDIGEGALAGNARERLEFLRADVSGDPSVAGEVAYIENFLGTTTA